MQGHGDMLAVGEIVQEKSRENKKRRGSVSAGDGAAGLRGIAEVEKDRSRAG